MVHHIVLGDHQQAARFAVEPMDDAGPRRPTAFAQFLQVVGERASKRTFPMAAGRMDDHPGRLIDHGQGVVLVEDFQRDILGQRTIA